MSRLPAAEAPCDYNATANSFVRVQVDLLHRWRDGGREDDTLLEALKATVKGIALGIQNTG